MQKYEITNIAYLISITYFLSYFISLIKRDATLVLVGFRLVRVRPIISFSAEFSAFRFPRFFIALRNFRCETKLLIKVFARYSGHSRILNCIHRTRSRAKLGILGSGAKLSSSVATIIFQISSLRSSKRVARCLSSVQLPSSMEKNIRNESVSRHFH